MSKLDLYKVKSMVVWRGFLIKAKHSKTQLLHFLSDRLKDKNVV